jgi:hypothetical protein
MINPANEHISGYLRQFMCPNYPQRKFFVCFRLRGTGEHRLKLEIAGPRGRDSGTLTKDGKVVFPPSESILDQAVDIAGIILKDEGTYTVTLLGGNAILGSTSFQCKLKEREQ